MLIVNLAYCGCINDQQGFEYVIFYCDGEKNSSKTRNIQTLSASSGDPILMVIIDG